MSKVFATYKKHFLDITVAEGHISLDKKPACKIILKGEGLMSQNELDAFAEHMVEGLNRSICGTWYGHRPEEEAEEQRRDEKRGVYPGKDDIAN